MYILLYLSFQNMIEGSRHITLILQGNKIRSLIEFGGQEYNGILYGQVRLQFFSFVICIELSKRERTMPYVSPLDAKWNVWVDAPLDVRIFGQYYIEMNDKTDKLIYAQQ